jgi:hypothetical protein
VVTDNGWIGTALTMPQKCKLFTSHVSDDNIRSWHPAREV